MEQIIDTLDMLDRKMNSFENAVGKLPVILEVLNMYGYSGVADILCSTFNQMETAYSKDEKLYNELYQEVKN